MQATQTAQRRGYLSTVKLVAWGKSAQGLSQFREAAQFFAGISPIQLIISKIQFPQIGQVSQLFGLVSRFPGEELPLQVAETAGSCTGNPPFSRLLTNSQPE